MDWMSVFPTMPTTNPARYTAPTILAVVLYGSMFLLSSFHGQLLVSAELGAIFAGVEAIADTLNPFANNHTGIRMISKVATGTANIDPEPPGVGSSTPKRASMAAGNNKAYPTIPTTEINRGTSFV